MLIYINKRSRDKTNIHIPPLIIVIDLILSFEFLINGNDRPGLYSDFLKRNQGPLPKKNVPTSPIALITRLSQKIKSKILPTIKMGKNK